MGLKSFGFLQFDTRRQMGNKSSAPWSKALAPKRKNRECSTAPVVSRLVSSRDIKCDYVVGSTILGKGVNGAVCLATGKADGRRYAVKRLRKGQKSEANVYLSLDHPLIARLECVYENDE